MSAASETTSDRAPGEGRSYLSYSPHTLFRGAARHPITAWLFTLDHKRIGVMYMVSILASFALGGVFALLVRTQLLVPALVHSKWISPSTTLMSRDTYNQMFTLHGSVMIFLFLIPAAPAILGNFVLPIMLGAKDVAFPRLNLLSLYFWWFGAIFSS